MTLAASETRSRRLDRAHVAAVIDLVETDFGRTRDRLVGTLAHQFLLDALDRGEHRRITVWPADDPIGVCYTGVGGLVVPAGLPEAGEGLAAAVHPTGWRILVGDYAVGQQIVELAGRGLFRRRPTVREQRLMTIAHDPGDVRQPGLRRAGGADIDRLTEFACWLHVEDQMGPPLSRSARASVRQRVAGSIRRGGSWLVELEGTIVAKVDVSIESSKRGAQLAGVYVDRRWRGRGIGTRTVAELSARLLRQSLPGVTLHVRADNTIALRAYRRAGFVDARGWMLALR